MEAEYQLHSFWRAPARLIQLLMVYPLEVIALQAAKLPVLINQYRKKLDIILNGITQQIIGMVIREAAREGIS